MDKCFICGEKAEKDKSIIINQKELCLCNKHYNRLLELTNYENNDIFDAISIISDEYDSENIKDEINTKIKNLTPHKIKEYLDERIIGQERAKKTLAVAVYNHYMRLLNKDIHIEKSNVLMVGPSGVGKTALAKALAEIVGVPFVICDATTVTEAGYVGDDVENMLLRLYQASDENLMTTEMGIIFIDEIDKIARKGENTSITRDVSGEGVQQALLKIIEGAEVDVPLSGGRKHPQGERIRINTSNILFICGGAFEDITMNNKKKTGNLGFATNDTNSEDEPFMGEVTVDELKKSGIIPELIGRLPIRVRLNSLTRDELKAILTDTKNSIVKQYINLVKLSNVKLRFSKDAIEFIADKAFENKTGARGLRSIIEQFMTDLMFDLPSESNVSNVTINVKNNELVFKKSYNRKTA